MALESSQNPGAAAFGNPQLPADFSVFEAAGSVLDHLQKRQSAFERIGGDGGNGEIHSVLFSTQCAID
jgi:hypothetical protein